MYKVYFKKSVEKDISKMTENMKRRILSRIENLSMEPRPRGVRKIKRAKDRWRIKIGNYRVVFTIDDLQKRVKVMYVRKREDAY